MKKSSSVGRIGYGRRLDILLKKVSLRTIVGIALAVCFGASSARAETWQEIRVAAKRGQQTIEPAALPLVCLAVVTDNIAVPIESLLIARVDRDERIKASFGISLTHPTPEVLTALQGDHRSLSLVILHLAPGRYRLVRVEFLGKRRSYFGFNLEKAAPYFFTVAPGSVNYLGSLVVSADWKAIQPSRVASVSFPARWSIEPSGSRDKKWAGDLIPGMTTLPSIDSPIEIVR